MAIGKTSLRSYKKGMTQSHTKKNNPRKSKKTTKITIRKEKPVEKKSWPTIEKYLEDAKRNSVSYRGNKKYQALFACTDYSLRNKEDQKRFLQDIQDGLFVFITKEGGITFEPVFFHDVIDYQYPVMGIIQGIEKFLMFRMRAKLAEINLDWL